MQRIENKKYFSGQATVSIVIPVYNREKLVGETIRSALAQTYSDIEVIVSDNQSTDRSYSVCLELAEADKRVQVYQNSTNIGPVLNWVAGISRAQGRFLKLLFSDDLLAPTAIEKMVASLQRQKTVSVFSSVVIGSVPWLGPKSYAFCNRDAVISSRKYLYRYLVRGDAPLSPCAFLFDRIAYEKVLSTLVQHCPPQFLVTGAGIDVLSITRMIAASGSVAYIDEPLIFFRHHGGSITVAKKSTISEAYGQAQSMTLEHQYGWLVAQLYRLLRWAKHALTFKPGLSK